MPALTDNDRQHLKQFIAHPGYQIWQTIADSYIQTMQEVATYTSQIEPLANVEKIASQWAAVAASKGYRAALDAGVKFEIAVLTSSQQAIPESEIDEERRRMWDALGMLEPMPANFHRRGDE